jgi:uncharacterized protein (TIGR02466 family)
MQDYKIEPLFSIPLYSSSLQRELTKEEKYFVSEVRHKTLISQGGNYLSKDNNILKNKELKNLKTFFDKHINNYFDKIIQTNNEATPYITQSWLNYNVKNSGHHIHSHPNSFFSGVFYINSAFDKDAIEFVIDEYPIAFSDIKKYDQYNSTHWSVPVYKGLLLLFPSTLRHYVKRNTHDHTRISLSFNVFVQGKIGSAMNLTELKITEVKDYE